MATFRRCALEMCKCKWCVPKNWGSKVCGVCGHEITQDVTTSTLARRTSHDGEPMPKSCDVPNMSATPVLQEKSPKKEKKAKKKEKKPTKPTVSASVPTKKEEPSEAWETIYSCGRPNCPCDDICIPNTHDVEKCRFCSHKIKPKKPTKHRLSLDKEKRNSFPTLGERKAKKEKPVKKEEPPEPKRESWNSHAVEDIFAKLLQDRGMDRDGVPLKKKKTGSPKSRSRKKDKKGKKKNRSSTDPVKSRRINNNGRGSRDERREEIERNMDGLWDKLGISDLNPNKDEIKRTRDDGSGTRSKTPERGSRGSGSSGKKKASKVLSPSSRQRGGGKNPGLQRAKTTGGYTSLKSSPKSSSSRSKGESPKGSSRSSRKDRTHNSRRSRSQERSQSSGRKGRTKKRVLCDNDEENIARYHCAECDKNLCKLCDDVFHRSKTKRNHKRAPLSKASLSTGRMASSSVGGFSSSKDDSVSSGQQWSRPIGRNRPLKGGSHFR